MKKKKVFKKIHIPESLILDSGKILPEYEIAYETYGKLNKKKSNAILICHALTGDQYCTLKNPVNNKNGWWNKLVGPGKVIDTNFFFVICSNVLGGCMGTTGPESINPETNKSYGLSFPVITINDMVKVQNRLVEALNIKRLFAVVGGSMGGMQALEWAASFGHKVHSVIPIASSYRHSAQNIAFHEIGRQAIMADSDWKRGAYYDTKENPKRGLSVARMIAHIT